MDETNIPAEVRRLLAEHIDSVEQLEMLLLLFRSGTEWTVDAVGEELRTSRASVLRRIQDLTQRRFLVRGSGPESYRFAKDNESRNAAVEALARVYAERPYTVIDLIFSKPIDNLRVYADAFRFRKGDSDG